MARIHIDFVKDYLEKNSGKSFIGMELTTLLKDQFSEISDNNAKLILNRAVKNKSISCSNPITFVNNQYAYFSNGTKLEYGVLADNIKKFKKALHRTIFALKRNGGILSKREVCKISGASIKEEAHYTSYSTIVGDLKKLEIAHVVRRNEVEYVLLDNCRLGDDFWEELREKQERENLILYLSLQCLVRSNLIDSKQLCFSGEANHYCGIIRNDEIWDAFGFSNAVGIGTNRRDFETMVFVDYLPDYTFEEYDFEGFKQRIDRIVFSTRGSRRKVLPIVLYKEASPNAISQMRNSGFLYYNISALMGDKVFDIARKFIKNVTSIKRKINDKTLDYFNEIQDSLAEIHNSGNETNYGNLKGELFEYVMYSFFNKAFPNCIVTHGFSGSVKGKKFECDILVETSNENIIIELKGYKKDSLIVRGIYDQETKKYTPNSILWFLNVTFALCTQLLGKQKSNRFCYITTAHIEATAKEELFCRKKNKPRNLEPFYEHESLLELLKEHGMERERKTIEKYYS